MHFKPITWGFTLTDFVRHTSQSNSIKQVRHTGRPNSQVDRPQALRQDARPQRNQALSLPRIVDNDSQKNHTNGSQRLYRKQRACFWPLPWPDSALCESAWPTRAASQPTAGAKAQDCSALPRCLSYEKRLGPQHAFRTTRNLDREGARMRQIAARHASAPDTARGWPFGVSPCSFVCQAGACLREPRRGRPTGSPHAALLPPSRTPGWLRWASAPALWPYITVPPHRRRRG